MNRGWNKGTRPWVSLGPRVQATGCGFAPSCRLARRAGERGAGGDRGMLGGGGLKM